MTDALHQLELLVADARAHGAQSIDCAALEALIVRCREQRPAEHLRRDLMQVWPLT